MSNLKKIISRLLFCDEKDLGGVLLHMPVGVANVLLGVYVGWWLGLAICLGFIIYERTERKIISDKCFPDLQGWLWGTIGTGGLIWLITSTR